MFTKRGFAEVTGWPGDLPQEGQPRRRVIPLVFPFDFDDSFTIEYGELEAVHGHLEEQPNITAIHKIELLIEAANPDPGGPPLVIMRLLVEWPAEIELV